QRPQLIVCILPNTGASLYTEIKRVTDTVIGVASQCIQSKHLHNPIRQYCANICLKINVKLGGMNSFLSSSQLPFINEKPTLVVGAVRLSPVSYTNPASTIAALVGSLDAHCCRFSSSIRTQSAKTEWIQDLAGMMVEILRSFYQTSGLKPLSILFYRDALSNTTADQTLEKEMSLMAEAFQVLEPGYRPAVSYIACQKRHHAKFFPLARRDAKDRANILPGTVVDSLVTHPSHVDFYLASHPGLQGTTKPAYYHVLADENNISSQDLQTLTYRMCYLYARATRSVSIVPPVYYAQIVANRAKLHVQTSKSNLASDIGSLDELDDILPNDSVSSVNVPSTSTYHL
ncbi:Eukaryotic translation initiation factor 2C, partial [Kappamyces sp. JEL0680]